MIKVRGDVIEQRYYEAEDIARQQIAEIGEQAHIGVDRVFSVQGSPRHRWSLSAARGVDSIQVPT